MQSMITVKKNRTFVLFGVQISNEEKKTILFKFLSILQQEFALLVST